MKSKSKLVVSVPRSAARGMRLGDLVAQVSKAVGVKPCNGCKKRQRSLNRFTLRV